jgi:hypothetical protein
MDTSNRGFTQTYTSRTVGTRTLAIAANRFGHWFRYVGMKRGEMFVMGETEARAWLAAQADDAAPSDDTDVQPVKATGKAKLTVVTPVGTFTRTTARTYTHIVVAGPYKAEWLAYYGIAAKNEAGVLGWCGRLDLARKLAAANTAMHFEWVRIYDVAGQEAK